MLYVTRAIPKQRMLFQQYVVDDFVIAIDRIISVRLFVKLSENTLVVDNLVVEVTQDVLLVANSDRIQDI